MNQVVIISPQELQNLIKDAVSVEVQKLLIPKKSDIVHLPDYLTITQASEFLNLAKPTIYGMVSKRLLPFMKQGKKLYFSKKELIQYLESGKKATKKELIDSTKKLGYKYGN